MKQTNDHEPGDGPVTMEWLHQQVERLRAEVLELRLENQRINRQLEQNKYSHLSQSGGHGFS